jgi:hypothetical protein
LCDADGPHHVPVQLDLLRDKFFCLAEVDLSVSGARQKQFSSTSIKLRRAAFVCLNVSALVADHPMKGLAKLSQAERVRAGPGEHKINIAIDFENLSDACAHLRGPFVLAVRRRIRGIRLLQSCPCLGTNRRGVITGEVVTNRVGPHSVSITRVCPTDNRRKEIA